MKILALEFSSPQRSVAVVSVAWMDELHESQTYLATQEPGSRATYPSETRVSEVIETMPGNTMKPLGMIEETLQQAGLEREQVDCVAVGIGPGSYAGVRVAIALAQGWQLARSVKLLGVSSAECVAAQAQADGVMGKCSVVIDAQREEFYLATYEIAATGLREVEPLKLATLAEVHGRGKSDGILIGPEVARWFDGGHVVFPRAATMGRLALHRRDFISGENLEPVYLRETNFVKAPPVRIVP